VSRTFVARTRDLFWKLMNRPLADLCLAVIMLDGIELHGRTNIVALGITTEGDKLALGLWDELAAVRRCPRADAELLDGSASGALLLHRRLRHLRWASASKSGATEAEVRCPR
jgi:hypothetical protein